MFTDVERLIFSYPFRGGTRYADPMAVRRQFAQLTRDPEQLLDELRSPEPARWMAAAERFFPAVRVVFGFPPAAPDRCDWPSEEECTAIWNLFQDYEVKKNEPGGNVASSGSSPASPPQSRTPTILNTPCGCASNATASGSAKPPVAASRAPTA